MPKVKERLCTKCGVEKPIEEFTEKNYPSRCRQCASKYIKEWKRKKKKKEKETLLQNSNTKDFPIFEKKPNMINQELNTLVRRKQEVLLSGEVNKFIKVSCPCGISINLEYKYSFDSENDYYEGICDICKRLFKQTITTNPH